MRQVVHFTGKYMFSHGAFLDTFHMVTYVVKFLLAVHLFWES